MVLPIQRDRPALEVPGYSVIRRATRRLRARFASRAQTRSHYVIRLSDAATKFERAIGDYRVLLWIRRLKVRILPPQPPPANAARVCRAGRGRPWSDIR